MATEPAKPLDAKAFMRIMAGLFYTFISRTNNMAEPKPFSPYEEQLSILRGRGLAIPDEELAFTVASGEKLLSIKCILFNASPA